MIDHHRHPPQLVIWATTATTTCRHAIFIHL